MAKKTTHIGCHKEALIPGATIHTKKKMNNEVNAILNLLAFFLITHLMMEQMISGTKKKTQPLAHMPRKTPNKI